MNDQYESYLPRINIPRARLIKPKLNPKAVQSHAPFKDILKKESMGVNEAGQILLNMINRKRFTYSAKDICSYLCQCLFLRSK
jgi:hypothetical protein